MKKGHSARIVLYIIMTALAMGAIYMLSSQKHDSSVAMSEGVLNIVRKLMYAGGLDVRNARLFGAMICIFALGICAVLLFFAAFTLRSRWQPVVYTLMMVLVMCAIFFLSAQDGHSSQSLSDGFLASVKKLIALLPPLTDEGPENDVRKYAHMFEYFVLGICCFMLFAEVFLHAPQQPSAAALSAYVFCFVYAGTDEFHQYFVPGRAAKFSDVLVDSVGFTAGIMLMLAVSLICKHRKRRSADE